MHEHIVKQNKEKQDFLTSCFFYYQNSIYNSSSSSSKISTLSNAFKKIKTTPLIIIDYPNIIHILQEEFHTQEEVAKHFYQYLLKNNTKKLIVILCKQVTINNESYNIELLLNLGRSLSNLSTSKSPIPSGGRFISEKGNDYHALEKCEGLKNQTLSFTNLFIYQIDYEKHISSSMDDLLGYFICFVSFVYYLRTLSLDLNEKSTQKKIQKHIQYLTNDKQYFDKNLFGKNKDERRENNYLIFEKIVKPHNQYILEKDPMNEKLVRHFLKEYMVLKTEDTKDLECNIHFLLNTLVKSNQERKKQFTYKNMNQLRKPIHKKQKQGTRKKCEMSKSEKKGKLLPSYYLYAMIKYTQNYLKNDFYGSFSKDELIRIFL
jgi:hypothetical protein